MEKKFEIIPLLPYRAGSINRTEEEKKADGKTAPDDKLQLSKCQVVRKEFLPHTRDYSLTFSDMRFYASQSCLRKFPNVNAVLTLIDPDERLLILLPCDENTPNAFIWRSFSKGKPIPRKSASPVLYGMIFNLMQWDLNTRYRVLGRVVYEDEKTLLVFDLKKAEAFPRSYSDDNTSKATRRARYPETWREQFGITYGEHTRLVNMKIFGEYSVFTAAQGKKRISKQPEPEPGSNEMREDVTLSDE